MTLAIRHYPNLGKNYQNYGIFSYYDTFFRDSTYYNFPTSSTTFCLVSSVFCSSILAETKPMFSTCQ